MERHPRSPADKKVERKEEDVDKRWFVAHKGEPSGEHPIIKAERASDEVPVLDDETIQQMESRRREQTEQGDDPDGPAA